MIYSTQLVAHFFSAAHSGAHTLFTCPAGKVTVVRDVSIVGYTSGGLGILTMAGIDTDYFTPPAANATLRYECRRVLNAADTITCFLDVNAWAFLISGYELSV